MAGKDDKLLNLKDGRVLYNDLRDRIEGIEPGAQIDDTAGAGDTDKVWSADKSAGEVSDLMSALGDKLDEPSTPGTSGQVLTSDGQGGQSWQTPSVPVQDVQVNGTSVVTSGVANVPIADNNTFGAVKVQNAQSYGVKINSYGLLDLFPVPNASVKAGGVNYLAINPAQQHRSVFYGLAKLAGADMKDVTGETVGVYPEAQKSAISQMLNAPVTVSGTTPSITALPGIQYLCGEVSTLDITLPASGCIDVVFESGSTPTVLTITPPTGVTLKWANGFDPTSLEANTTYEINIANGLGVAASWT